MATSQGLFMGVQVLKDEGVDQDARGGNRGEGIQEAS